MSSVYDRVKKKLTEDERAQEHDKIAAAANRCFATADGKYMLFYLMNVCGWKESVVSANHQNADLNDRGTLYLAARRDVYLELRQLVKPEILKEVEFHNQKAEQAEGE